MLESAGGTLRVHPGDASSFFRLLPEPEAAWVIEADADAIAAVPGPGGELAGVLLAGPRFDGRPVRAADLPFLEALGTAAGLALGRLWAARPPGTPAPEAPPARECPVFPLAVATRPVGAPRAAVAAFGNHRRNTAINFTDDDVTEGHRGDARGRVRNRIPHRIACCLDGRPASGTRHPPLVRSDTLGSPVASAFVPVP